MLRLINFIIISLCTSLIYSQVNSFPNVTDFETQSIGNWRQAITDNTDWTINSGTTPSGLTGPSSAFQGEYYLYTEATGNWDALAYIDFYVDFTGIASPILSFAYHMFGASMGSLKLQFSVDNVIWMDLGWIIAGDQGDIWHEEVVDLSILTGVTCYIRFNAKIGPSWTSDMALDNICVSDGGICEEPLPIELLYFSTETYDNYVDVNWATATEFNSDYYNIQRSKYGFDFSTIAKIPAAGNSYYPLYYKVEDTNPYSGIYYYRMEQYDLDGTYKIYGLIEAQYKNKEIKITQYSNHIKITLPEDIVYDIIMFDMTGRKILHTHYSDYYELLTTSYPKGIYFLTINGNNNMYTQQIGIY